MYPMSYQTYKSEHGLTTAAEQRAADVHAGATAAALRDLGLSLGRAFRLGHRVHPAGRVAYLRPARMPANTATAPARALTTSR